MKSFTTYAELKSKVTNINCLLGGLRNLNTCILNRLGFQGGFNTWEDEVKKKSNRFSPKVR